MEIVRETGFKNTPNTDGMTMNTSKLEEAQEVKPIEFDPSKDYVWKPTDRFKLKGRELEIMHNTLGAIFSGQVPEPQMYLMLNEMLKITTGIIRENVELGVITEKEEYLGDKSVSGQ